MNDPRHKLTADIQGLICGLIRAGAFPHVAAEAAGIPQRVFERWVHYGQARQPAEEYRLFAAEVMKAKAHARALAEAEARKRAPVTWLRSGPGRESDGKPGWTGTVRPAPVKSPEDAGTMSERTWKVWPKLLEALMPFPEARAAAAAVLAEEGVRRAKEVVEAATQEGAKPQAAMAEDAKPQAAMQESAKPQAAMAEDAKPQAATPEDAKPQAATPKVSPTQGETTAKVPRIDFQTAPNVRPDGGKPATCVGPELKAMRNKPSAWDPLDAGHWTVFGSG